MNTIVSAASVVSATAVASPSGWRDAEGVDVRLFELWEQRRRAAAAARVARAQYEAANKRLPAWAKPGPQFVNRKGKRAKGSMTVGWPAIEMTAAELAASASKQILVRPSPYMIAAANLDDLDHKTARKLRDSALAALRQRRRRQKAEERKVGLPELEKAIDATYERVEEVEAEIQKLSPSTPHLIAAMILIGVARVSLGSESLDGRAGEPLHLARSLLTSLRPYLRGTIGAEVSELLDNPEKPIGEMAFKAELAAQAA
jgi:ribosomal protein S25